MSNNIDKKEITEENRFFKEYNSIIDNGLCNYLSILIDDYSYKLVDKLRCKYSLWESAIDNMIDIMPINGIVKALIKPIIHSLFINIESKIIIFIQEYQNIIKDEIGNFINHHKNKIIDFFCSYIKDTLFNFTDKIFNQEKLQKIDQLSNININDYNINYINIEATIDIELSGNINDII